MAVLGSLTADLFATTLFLLCVYYLRKYVFREKDQFITKRTSFRQFLDIMRGRSSFVYLINDFYAKFKPHRFGGVYTFGTYFVVVCDPELIKHVLTKDFSTFHDRGLPHSDSDDFASTLINLKGPRWKTLRSQLSPTFTSGKIKGMFPLIEECTHNLKDVIQAKIKEKNGSVEMRELLIRFSTDVIGTCAFGMQCNSLKNSSSEFYKHSRNFFRNTVGSLIRSLLINIMPKLANVLTLSRQFPDAVKFYTDTISRTVTFRRENNVERNDFVQLLMKINEADPASFNAEIMAGQAFVFFFAGLDNIAQSTGFCLHYMALNPDLQERVFEEISSVLKEFKGEMSYEALWKMDLVSRVIDEGLRLYPPAGILIRKQTDDKYTIPGTDVVIKKGTMVMVPMRSVHRDEEYYPDPEKFDPDRFTAEEKAKRHPYVYLPFGDGPRFCIASRFALMEMRLCFAELIRNFRFSVAPETDISLELDPRAPGPTPKKGFWFSVSERN